MHEQKMKSFSNKKKMEKWKNVNTTRTKQPKRTHHN